MTSGELLEALAGYLGSEGLAQFNPNADYDDHPDLPGILFGSADTPDTALVLSVTGTDPGLGDWDVSATWRAVGISPGAVEHLADAVFDHFRAVIGVQVATFEGGTAVVLPELHWDDITVVNCERTQRGTAELTSPAKHKGTRFTRTDVYKLTAFVD